MQQFDYQGQSIYYSEEGSGKTIVLLHGFLEDSSIWGEVLKTFKTTNKVILIDLPCHGKSRFQGEICSMRWMAEITHSLLSNLGVKNATIIGHSMGGYVGLELSKLMEIDVILLHSNFWEDPPQKKIDRNRVIEIVRKNKNLFITEAIPGLFAPKNIQKCKAAIEKLIATAKNIPDSEIMAATAGLRDRLTNNEVMESGRVSIIHGELDPIITNEKLQAEIETLSFHPTVHIIKDCGHMSIWESPDMLVSLIKKALKSRN